MKNWVAFLLYLQVQSSHSMSRLVWKSIQCRHLLDASWTSNSTHFRIKTFSTPESVAFCPICLFWVQSQKIVQFPTLWLSLSRSLVGHIFFFLLIPTFIHSCILILGCLFLFLCKYKSLSSVFNPLSPTTMT